MAERVFAVDENFDFPAPVAARQAARLGDAATAEGAALKAGIEEHTSGLAGAAKDVTTRLSGRGITRPLISGGKIVAGFGSGQWAIDTGTPTLSQGHTGYDPQGNRTGLTSRTGQPEMLRYQPSSNAHEGIVLGAPNVNIQQKLLGGQIGLWVYVDNQPGFEPGGAVTGTIGIMLTTGVGPAYANGLRAYFNQNQVREGWNFLKFVQRNPAAYTTSGGATEYHPYGVYGAKNGDGSTSDIKNKAITGIKIDTQNLGGATLYFDSLWTGLDTQAQVVFGIDLAEKNTVDFALPALEANGWVGYIALTGRVWTGGDKSLGDLSASLFPSHAKTMYESGWEVVNHCLNHLPGTQATPRMGQLTNPAEIHYEMERVNAAYSAYGFTRGTEFYASPQQSTSRLAEKVVRDDGYLLQRHARKQNTTVTPWGVDNPQHVGAIPIDSAASQGLSFTTAGTPDPIGVTGFQKFSKIRRAIDVMAEYGDTIFLFCHTITELGDTGSGEDLTGNDIIITRSAFQRTMDYLKQREDAGVLRVRDGISGFYYGTGR